MNGKILCIIAVALAVIAGSIAAVVVTVKRADIARAQVEIAASKEAEAQQQRKAAEKEADAEKAKQATVEKEQQLKKEQVRLNQSEKERVAEENRLAETERKTAEANAKTAAEERAKAELMRDSQRLALKVAEATNKTLQASVRLAEAKAKSETAKAEQEKLRNERELAAVKALELRKIDFDTLEQQLVEWKQELEERERAIAPEKSIADLDWVGNGEDSVLDDKGNVVRQVKVPYRAENDRKLSKATRELARLVRQNQEAMTNRASCAKASIVSALERLYVAALKDDRPIDADYYAKSIRVMYPDWKLGKDVDVAE